MVDHQADVLRPVPAADEHGVRRVNHHQVLDADEGHQTLRAVDETPPAVDRHGTTADGSATISSSRQRAASLTINNTIRFCNSSAPKCFAQSFSWNKLNPEFTMGVLAL